MNQPSHAFGTQPAAAGTRANYMARALAALAARWSGAAQRPQADVGAGLWIRPRQPLVLGRSQRRTLVCDAGTVWITQGDRADYILEAGQSLALHPADEVVVTAMAGPARIHETRQPAGRAAGTNGGP